jgi:hypothetical protein
MNTQAIIEQIDSEISRLQQARKLLGGTDATDAKRGPGRPKKSDAVAGKPVKRKLSAKGRKAISDAMKKRWAKRKVEKV